MPSRSSTAVLPRSSPNDDLKFESDSMDDERVALEKQARCMLDLEEKYKMTQAAALGGEGKQDR